MSLAIRYLQIKGLIPEPLSEFMMIDDQKPLILTGSTSDRDVIVTSRAKSESTVLSPSEYRSRVALSSATFIWICRGPHLYKHVDRLSDHLHSWKRQISCLSGDTLGTQTLTSTVQKYWLFSARRGDCLNCNRKSIQHFFPFSDVFFNNIELLFSFSSDFMLHLEFKFFRCSLTAA